MRIKLSLSISFMLLTAFSSCTPTMSGLQKSDAFTHNLIQSEGMSIGGVVDIEKPMSDSDRNKLSGILRNSIMDERENIRVSPLGNFINALGEDEAKRIWQIYQKNGTLSEAELQMISDKSPQNRFLVLAKLENNRTSTSSNYQSPRTEEDSKGNKTKIPGKTVVTTSRDVTYSINIYDLKLRNSAFSGSLSDKKSNSNEYQDKKQNLIDGIVSVVQAVNGTTPEEEHPAPSAPSFDEMSRTMFSGFAKNFPKKD